MKKNLKRNFKRWIAFVLAVVIIMTTCVYSSDAYLRATDNPEQTEAVQEPTVVTDTIVPEDIPEEVIEEETDEPEEEEEIQQETPEEEIEDTSDDDEPEEPEPIPNDETEENEEKPADTPEASPEENPEETPEESPEASPIETPEGEPTPIPSPEATATPSATPTASPEREETYGYAVYYYFDGVEDKSVRVEKEDGVLGEVILTSVESAAVHNGMNYVLDYVENENGKVSDNPDNNIVRIYYVLAEEDAKVYTVVLEHILSTDNLGTFRSEETIRLTDKDLADGSVNLIDRAYSREGMECVTGEVVLSKDDFDSEYQAFARIDYGVADGWVAVLRGSGSAPASGSPRRARAVYVGKIDDVEFVKAGQIPVSISFVYEDGSIALDSETVMVEEENGEYNFTHSFKGIAGYTAELDEATPDEYNISGSADTGYQITAKLEFSEDTASGDSVGVVFKAGEGEYTVVTRVPTKGNKSVTDDPATYTETSETFTDKKVGELTEVEAKAITGFTPKAVKQQTVTGDGTTEVIVEYVRNNYTVTYDTQGGSYVKAEKWLYEDEAKVYDGESGKPGSDEVRKLICGKEEHTHDIWNGCYEWTGRNWNLTCTKEEHTHSSSCYFVSPAVPPTSSTFAPAPTRQGYTFTGWYKDAECTIPAEKTIASIDSDVTVYAGWEKKEVSYTVLYFIENANDTDYSFLSSEIKTGYAGNTVTVTAETASPSGLDTKNFTFKKATSAAIAADGSTVIKAYYSRNVYTLTSNKSFRINGKDQKLSLSAKYGANITEIMNREWNEPTGNKYAWTLTNSDSNKVAVFDTMPSGGGTVYSYEYQATREQTLSYWLENYNGSEQIKFDERTYGLYKEITVKFNYLTYSADFYEFPDYTKYKAMHGSKQLWGNNKGNVTTSNGMKVDFYYNANDVSLELFGYEGERISFNQVAIGADISSYLTEPTAPVDGAGFKGWYTDPAHTEKYTGGKKMPTSGLILYADWDMPKYEVTFMDGSETYKVQEVEYLKKVEEVEIMHEGFDFLGWYADSDYKEEFDFSQPITKDITVYAKWDEKLDTSCLIRHIVKDGDSEIDIVEPKEVVGMIGDTVSVRAISLSGDYRDYVADANEKSIVLSTKSKNEITFVYSPLNAIRYRVEYVYNGDIKAEQKDIEAEAKSFRVYPDKEIGTKLNKEGYKIKEGYAQANLTSDNSKNVVRFELAPNEYDITYAGIDDDTNTPVTITVPDANPKKYTVVSEDIPLMWPSFDTEEYNFEGWTTNGTVNGESQENTLVKDIVIGKGSIGRLTFTAHFTRKPVTLSYDGNGHTGGKTDATKGKVGKPITIAQNGFEKTGYTFVGWNTQADGQGTSYSAGQEVTIRKPLTLYAQWEANKNVSYTVHYYLKDTTTKVADDKVEQNKTFDAEYTENAVVVQGYTAVEPTTQSFTLDSLNKEITFYYTADDAEITFVTNGGSAVEPMKGVTGGEITNRAMPTTNRTGYTFNGWYGNVGLTGEEVRSLPEKYPAGTTTYYAAWKANENVSYTVHYYLEGTMDSVAADKTEEDKTFGKEYTEHSKEVPGYTVVGSGQQSFTLDSLNKEIIFYYTADDAEITFVTNGGSAVAPMKGVTGQEITDQTMPTTERTGYTFNGWYGNAELTGEAVRSLPEKYPAGTTTYYASWTAKTDVSYTVHYYLEDTTTSVAEDKVEQNKTFDAEYSENAKVIPGYTVVGDSQQSFTLDSLNKEIIFYYTADDAEITFVTNGGSAVEAMEGVTGQAIMNREMPTTNRTGYTFNGWYGNAGLAGEEVRSLPEKYPAGTTTYYAAWKANENVSYTVHYYLEGTMDSVAADKTEEDKTFGKEYTEHSKEVPGYTVVGSGQQSFTLDSLNKEIIFYYTADDAEITFVTNGGSAVAPMKGVTGQEITDQTMPTTERTGYTFNGWYGNAELTGEAVRSLPEKYPAGTTTYYASWMAKTDVSYTVHYYLKDTTTSVAEDKVEQNKTFDAEYSENAKVIPGYTVVGDGQQSFTLDSLDKEIIFYYTADDAEITFVTNGGSAVAPMEGKTGQEIASREMPTTTRTGYTFNGWYNNAGLTGEKVGSLPEKYPAGTTTYYAAWKANENVSYIVHYYLQGTTDSVAADKTEVNKTFGGSYTEYSKRVTGYTVVGDGQQSFTLDSLNKEITFYYTADAAQITFATNGGSAVDDMEGVTGQEITNRAMPTTARTGYTFNGWYDSAELTGEPVGSLPEKYPAGTTTYYASWTVKTDVSYTVHYYLEDTTTSVAEDKVEQNKTFDAEYTESAVVVTGYTAAEPATQSFTLDSLNKEITFYYTADAAHITFVTNGGSAVEAMEGATGQEITNRAMPTTARTGYTFNGWYGSAELTGEPVGSLPEKYPAGTTTYYAAWSANTDTVYTVQYHYQSPSDGVYSDEEPVEKKGTTDTSVSLPGTALIPDTTIHKLESGRYIYDTSDNRNVISGNVEGDGSLALHVYFPIQYTVSGTIDHGTVTEASQDVRYAAASSAMSFKAGENYVIKSIKINGEEQEVEDNQIEYIYPAQTAVRSDIAVEITTEEMNPQLTLVKTVPEGPADKVAYVLGETINYKIVATNTGNLTLTGITVKDEMVGKEWEIEGDFKPGDTWERTVSYKVDEDDIKAGKVVNSVTAEVSDLEPDYPEPEVIPGEVESPVATPNPSLYVQKTALGNDDPNKTYARDEVVTYTIKVINNGNVTIKGIQLTDPLTGLEWNVGTLVPGDSAIPLLRKPSKERTTRYTVTSADILAGEVVNTATASGTDPDGNMVTATGTETIRMAAIDTSYSITKELTSDARADGTYHAGDTLSYRITVKSDANVTLENIVVTDTLSNNVTGAVNFTKLKGISANDAGALAQAGITLNPDNTVKIGSLEPDEEVVLECEYVVTSADAALNTQLGITDSENAGIRNTVRATADTVNPPGKDPVDPEEETGESDPAETEDTYTLTIQYQYADGTMAADAVTRYYPVGETYVVASPVIAGYNSSLAAVTGVMPDRDVNVTVVYSIPTPPTPPTPDEPEPTPPISPEPPTPPTPDEPEPPAPPVPPTPEEPEPPVEPIVEPAAPVVPGPAAAAAVQVVIPAALTAVGDEEVPLEGALIDVDDDGNVTVIPIEEEEIPLDNRELDDHKCCILSFLLMLATLIIYSWFTHSMKKRQKKLAELKDQLAEETLKRQLGIADTKESAR